MNAKELTIVVEQMQAEIANLKAEINELRAQKPSTTAAVTYIKRTGNPSVATDMEEIKRLRAEKDAGRLSVEDFVRMANAIAARTNPARRKAAV
jgi:uncharacterized small protein (DUF1192 family)